MEQTLTRENKIKSTSARAERSDGVWSPIASHQRRPRRRRRASSSVRGHRVRAMQQIYVRRPSARSNNTFVYNYECNVHRNLAIWTKFFYDDRTGDSKTTKRKRNERLIKFRAPELAIRNARLKRRSDTMTTTGRPEEKPNRASLRAVCVHFHKTTLVRHEHTHTHPHTTNYLRSVWACGRRLPERASAAFSSITMNPTRLV